MRMWNCGGHRTRMSAPSIWRARQSIGSSNGQNKKLPSRARWAFGTALIAVAVIPYGCSNPEAEAPTPAPALRTTSPEFEAVQPPSQQAQREPESSIPFGEALNQGSIEGSLRGLGVTSGDSVLVTLRRLQSTPLAISLPRGSVLLNNNENEPDMVVHQVRESRPAGSVGPYVENIQLTDDAWHEYVVEAYSLHARKGAASKSASFTVIGPVSSQVLQISEISDRVPGVSVEALQTAIWAVTDGVDFNEMVSRGYSPDLRVVRTIFEMAGLDPETKRLFGEREFSFAQGYIERGNRFYETGEYAQALADYSDAIELDPGSAESFYRRGFVLMQREDFAGAIVDFSHALRIEPNNPSGHLAMGIAYRAKPEPDHDLSLSYLTRAIDLGPNFPDAHHERGITLLAMSNPAQAIADFDQSIVLDPQFAEAYYSRAQARFAREDFREAVRDLDEAIRLNPSLPEAFHLRGLSNLNTGMVGPAVRDLEAYLQLDPETSERGLVEELILRTRGEIPAPDPGQLVSLIDALDRGWVIGEIRGLGVVAGDSIYLSIMRASQVDIELFIPPGTVLISDNPNESDMVVRQVRGAAISETDFQPAETMSLAKGGLQQYFVEAYSVNFDKNDPGPSTTFLPGGSAQDEVLRVLRAVEKVPRALRDIVSVQAAIWVVTDDVHPGDLATVMADADLDVVRAILEAAAIDVRCTKLLGTEDCP